MSIFHDWLVLFKILSRRIKEIEEDQRISDLLKILREKDVSENFSDSKTREHLTAESLDNVFFSY
jgi:hypothetical protein